MLYMLIPSLTDQVSVLLYITRTSTNPASLQQRFIYHYQLVSLLVKCKDVFTEHKQYKIRERNHKTQAYIYYQCGSIHNIAYHHKA